MNIEGWLLDEDAIVRLWVMILGKTMWGKPGNDCSDSHSAITDGCLESGRVRVGWGSVKEDEGIEVNI